MPIETKSIKVGDERILITNITHINERISDNLQERQDGTFFENWDGKDEDKSRGLVVTINFLSTGDTPDYVRLFKDEAEEFLRKFDFTTNVI